jgi:hypothetical protein
MFAVYTNPQPRPVNEDLPVILLATLINGN